MHTFSAVIVSLCCLYGVAPLLAQDSNAVITPLRHHAAEGAHPQQVLLHVPVGSLAQQKRLLLQLERQQRTSLDLVLGDSNGRWWRYHTSLRSSGRRISIPLDRGHWTGPHGPLDAGARASISRIQLHSSAAVLQQPQLATVAHNSPAVALIRPIDSGFRREGPWYTLRLQIVGTGIDSVALTRPNRRPIPAFRSTLHHQHGPEVWQVRLRPDEIELESIDVLVRARDGRLLEHRSIPLADTNEQPLPLPSGDVSTWPLLSTPATTGLHYLVDHQGQQVASRSPLPPALAPILRWRDDWSGFSGMHASNHGLASSLDQRLATDDISDIDLLPDLLWRDDSVYAFANAPWHVDHGGPLHHPLDSWEHPALWQQLRSHALDIIARCRAAPELQRWRLSCQLAIAQPQGQQAVAHRIMDRFAELVSHYDHRPLHILHPGTIAYRRIASDGLAILADARMSLQLDDQGSARSHIDLDESLWSWERARYLVANPGATGVSLYAWMSDRHHRFYQQHIAYLHPQTPSHMVEVAWGDDSAWQPVGHDLPWDISQRDRVRTLGMYAVADDASGAGQSIPITPVSLVGWPADPPPEVSLSWLEPIADQAHRWQPYQLHFTITPQVDNPYDPQHADIMAELVDPDGNTHTFPAFWLEPHELQRDAQGSEQVRPSKHGHWAWRYAFSQTGTWRLRMLVRLDWRGRHRRAETPWHEITVHETETAMLPVEPSDDVRYWQTSDGAWFYPMGITLRSPGDDRQDVLLRQFDSAKSSAHWQQLGTQAYDHWFARMAEHGGNFARIWMSPWWTGLEWHRSWDGYQGLGRYNQANAARMDRLLELAAKHGIYLQIELLNHGMTSETVDEQWHPDAESDEPGSPYNAVNGGPVERAAAFFSDEQSWNHHRNRLRYTIARWGHAPQIMAWVLSSEMEFTGAFWDEAYNVGGRNAHSPTLERWIQRNLDWLADHDHHQRPVSIHFSHPWRAETMWQMEDLGFSYSNAYTGYQSAHRQLGGERTGLRGALFTYLVRHFPPWHLKRPTLLGEWGGHWMERDPDVLEAEFGPGLWMQAVLPFSGNTGFWWWLWVDASDNWRRMAPVRRFIQDIDPRGRNMQPMMPQVIAPHISDGQLQAVGSRGTGLIVCYLYNQEDRHVAPQTASDDAIQLLLRSIPAQTSWRWFRYDPMSGAVIAEGTVESSDQGTLMLPVEHFTGQAAWRLIANDPTSDAHSTPPSEP